MKLYFLLFSFILICRYSHADPVSHTEDESDSKDHSNNDLLLTPITTIVKMMLFPTKLLNKGVSIVLAPICFMIYLLFKLIKILFLPVKAIIHILTTPLRVIRYFI